MITSVKIFCFVDYDTEKQIPGFIGNAYFWSFRYNQTQMRSDATIGGSTVRPHVYPRMHH